MAPPRFRKRGLGPPIPGPPPPILLPHPNPTTPPHHPPYCAADQKPPAASSPIDALARCGELQPDAVVSETGLPAYRVGPLLIALEMKSLVRRSPDGSCSLRRR